MDQDIVVSMGYCAPVLPEYEFVNVRPRTKDEAPMGWNGHNVPADTFINRPPSKLQGQTYDKVTDIFMRTGDLLTDLLPPSRYASLCLTALEEACMWAKKCVAFEVDQGQPGERIKDHAFAGDNLTGEKCMTCGGHRDRHDILSR